MDHARRSILIVDGDDAFRSTVAALLKAEPFVDTIGHASTACEALAVMRHVAFDVVVMDVALPDESGVDVARRIQALRPDTSVVLVGTHPDRTFHTTARAVGAIAFLVKRDVPGRLPDLVRQLLSGVDGHASEPSR